MPAFPTCLATVELATPAHWAVPSASVAPHHEDARNATPFVLEAVIARKAKTLPELFKLARTTALPAVVVAAPFIHCVWSVIPTEASLSKSQAVLAATSSPDSVTFQPATSLVVTESVVVAILYVPGVRVPNWSLLVVKVRVCATVTVKVTAAL